MKPNLLMPNLLVAENDPTLVRLYRQFFARNGYQVEAVAGGLECVRKLRGADYPLLVLDQDIPWGGGDGVLAVMRDDARLARIPVLLTTNGADADAAPADARPPVAWVMRKPFSLAALLAGVRVTETLGQTASWTRLTSASREGQGRERGGP